MVEVVFSGVRRALAVVVLAVAGLLAAWVALFSVGHPDEPLTVGFHPLTPAQLAHLPPARCGVGTNYCLAVRPEWTIPAAIAIALGGVFLAVLVHRPRRGRAERRGIDLRAAA